MDLPGFLSTLLFGQTHSNRFGNRLRPFFFIAIVAILLTVGCTVVAPAQMPSGPVAATRTGSFVALPYDAKAEATAPISTEDPTATAAPSPTVTRQPTGTAAPTETATWTPTAVPSETATVTPTATETAEPTPLPLSVGGIPVDEIALLPPAVRQQIRETYALGQQLGRNPNAFSKIGDSVTLTAHYLTRFDSGTYVLGDYAYLQPAIDQYAGSFARYGVATRVGLHAWALFDPIWADKEWCQPNEHMVACEVRLHNPSILLIRLGSNDSGAATAFDENMRALVTYALENGIIPILGTKADRFEGPDNRNNLMIRQIAADYNVPIWDFDRVSEAIPRRGLGSDQVHMTMADSNDYTDPKSFERGYPVSDLTALMTLHEVYREVAGAGE